MCAWLGATSRADPYWSIARLCDGATLAGLRIKVTNVFGSASYDVPASHVAVGMRSTVADAWRDMSMSFVNTVCQRAVVEYLTMTPNERDQVLAPDFVPLPGDACMTSLVLLLYDAYNSDSSLRKSFKKARDWKIGQVDAHGVDPSIADFAQEPAIDPVQLLLRDVVKSVKLVIDDACDPLKLAYRWSRGQRIGMGVLGFVATAAFVAGTVATAGGLLAVVTATTAIAAGSASAATAVFASIGAYWTSITPQQSLDCKRHCLPVVILFA